MTSPIHSLPPELLERTFSFLTNDQSSISASRLVSSHFRALSSRFLLSRVIFAFRLKEVTKLQQIAHHPYFSKHVTELIFDGSWFEGRYADDAESYAQALNDDEKRDDKDEQWLKERNDYQNLFRAVHRNMRRNWIGGNPAPTGVREESASEAEDSETSDSETSASEDNDQSEDGTSDQDSESEESTSDDASHSEESDALIDPYEFGNAHYITQFSSGSYRSFPDYARHYDFQERLDRTDLAISVLDDAFTRLPKLRHICLTDWRSLAIPGESYAGCTSRLFGNMLAPAQLDWNTITNTNKAFTRFQVLMKAIRNSDHANVESVSIGPHPFEEKHEIRVSPDPREIQYVHMNEFGNSVTARSRGVADDTKDVVSGLRSLRLPFSGFEFNEHLKNVLRAGQSLTSLMLSIYEAPHHGGTREYPDDRTPFEYYFCDLKLPKLRHLDLRSWMMPSKPFRDLLTRHVVMLRELRLIDCVLDRGVEASNGSAGDEDEELGDETMARWGGDNLQLEGVELDTGFATASCIDIFWHGNRPGERYVMLESGHESLWLAGRKNFIRREQFREHLCGEKWWLKEGRQ